jgi:hypothetical protein
MSSSTIVNHHECNIVAINVKNATGIYLTMDVGATLARINYVYI